MNNYESLTIFLLIILWFLAAVVIALIIELIRKGQEVDALHLCIEQEQRENECLRKEVDAIRPCIKQEQPEVDLEKEVDDYISDYLDGNDEGKVYVMQCARHFYELGLNTRKEVQP